jgi:hypothetical protein
MRKTTKMLAILGMASVVTACGGGGSGGSSSGSQPEANRNEGEPEVSVHLGKEEAISKVKLFLERNEGTVTVQLPYKHFETVSKPCSQMDVDTDPNKGDAFMARCKPLGGSGPAAPYGSRTVSEWRTKCCKPQTVRWATLNPIWTAEYSNDSDSWNVNMEFDVEAVKKAIRWTVNDKTGAVTEKP